MTASNQLLALATRVEADRARHLRNMDHLAEGAKRATDADRKWFQVRPIDMLAIAEAITFALAQQSRPTEQEDNHNG